MTIDTENMLNSILESISRIDYIKPDDVPNIDLYMDQITTFMDAQLSASKRYPDDKILTKTMINNYTKNNLLPPPVKKKYSVQHMLLLIFIYYFKNILSFTDIQTLLAPITKKYFNGRQDLDLAYIYEEVFSLEKKQIDHMKEDIKNCFEQSSKTYDDAPKEDQDFLHLFSFICMLSFDVYVKKQIIEKLIDQLPQDKR